MERLPSGFAAGVVAGELSQGVIGEPFGLASFWLVCLAFRHERATSSSAAREELAPFLNLSAARERETITRVHT